MTELLVVVVLVLVNGLFAGAEIALLSVRPTRVQELESEGRMGSTSVAELRAHPERLLATVQIGITVVGSAAAAFGGSSLAADVAEVVRPWLGEHADAAAFAVVVGAISYLSLVLGELVPKSLALRYAEQYSLLVAPSLRMVAFVARPLVYLLTTSSNLVLRLFSDSTSFVETRMSSDELRALVGEATTAGTVDAYAGGIASRAIEFNELLVSDVLVPRTDMICVAKGTPLQELARVTRAHGHSRILVHGDDREDILGYLAIRDVLAEAVARGDAEWTASILPPLFVPTSMRATTLLRDFQRKRVQLAVVVDESGTVRGLVTLEDLVEELVGDLFSERERAPDSIREDGPGRWVLLAATPLRDLARVTGLTLPEAEESSTLAGLVLEAAQRIPEVGARIRVGEVEVEVLEGTRRRLKKLAIHAPGSQPAA